MLLTYCSWIWWDTCVVCVQCLNHIIIIPVLKYWWCFRMGTLNHLAFRTAGCRQKVNDRLLSRLFIRPLAHSVIEKTFSSRTITCLGKTRTTMSLEKSSYHGLKSRLLNSRLVPSVLVPVQMISSCLRRDISLHTKKLGYDRSQWQILKRFLSKSPKKADSVDRTTTVIYICAIGVFMVGASYAGVPLYRIFCQVTFWKYGTISFSNFLFFQTVEKVVNIVIKEAHIH